VKIKKNKMPTNREYLNELLVLLSQNIQTIINIMQFMREYNLRNFEITNHFDENERELVKRSNTI